MRLSPAIQAELAAEQRRRSVNWLGATVTLCGSPVRPLTPRHVLELRLAGNAFFYGRRALLGDVFDVLWRLNPAFYRPASPRRFYDWPARSNLTRRVRRLDLFTAERAIHDYLSAAYLDRPAARADSESGPLEAEPHWIDSFIDTFGSHYAWATPERVLDTPIAQLFQLRRSIGIRTDEEIIDPVHERIAALMRPSK